MDRPPRAPAAGSQEAQPSSWRDARTCGGAGSWRSPEMRCTGTLAHLATRWRLGPRGGTNFAEGRFEPASSVAVETPCCRSPETVKEFLMLSFSSCCSLREFTLVLDNAG